MKKELITGVLPALITPLDQQGNVKIDQAQALIDLYTKQQADGLYMLGWTGEGEHLTVQQRKDWTEAVVQAAEGKLKVLVHVGYNEKLEDSVALAAHAQQVGAYAVSSVGISTEATLEENVAYFQRIAEAAPDLPFYIYWVAQGKTLTGGKDISPKKLLEAMEQVKTFCGIKFTDNNFYILERFKKYRPDLNILTGADELAICSQIMGADGNIGALQAITCYHHKQIFNEVASGNFVRARELQYQANEISEFYGQAEIGGIPGIKLILERVFGVEAGYASPNGPFEARTVDPQLADQLEALFREKILFVE